METPATSPIGGTFRRGLVLQGGGAKGAFQFGVLQELHEAGIEFDVIAGTSVGALNGAVVAAGAWELGDRLWSELTIGRAFRWSGWAAIYTVPSVLGVLYLGWLSTAYDSLLPVLLRRIFQLLASLPVIGCFLAFNLMFEKEGRSLRIVFLACTLALSAAAPFVVGKRNYFTRLGLTLPAVLVGPLAVLAGFKLSAVVLLLLNLSPLLLLIGFIHQRINAALFSNSPLRETVEAIVRKGIRQPLFATAAKVVLEYVDPDDYRYARMRPGFVYVVAKESGFLPVYQRVDKLNSTEAADALLASAALPLGIVPNSRSGAKRTRFVDGGVTDNTPWFPLIDSLPCEEIVVVLCEPEAAAGDEATLTRDRWRKRDRSIRVMTEEHDIPNHQMKTLWDSPSQIAVKHDPPIVVPFRNPQFWPESKRISPVVISPPHSLGNLLTGTMNFDHTCARENTRLGREAARVALANGRFK